MKKILIIIAIALVIIFYRSIVNGERQKIIQCMEEYSNVNYCYNRR